MRKLLPIAILLVALVLAAPQGQASATWCPPEYPTCNSTNTEGGTLGSTPYAPGGGGGNGTYEKNYGTDYNACAGSGSVRCLRCSRKASNNALYCNWVEYSGYCGCTEKYENYIVKSCTTRGSCDYF